MTIADNVRSLMSRIDAAAKKSGRQAKDVTLVVVTKGASGAAVLEAHEAGIEVFAENKIQEAETKVSAVQAQWHMIGHLQSNKIKQALSFFSLIQSVDSVRLAEKIEVEATTAGKTADVLLEINISGEKQKFGFAPEEIYVVLDAFKKFTHVRVLGLMGISPNTPDMEARRASFKKLKNIFGVCKSAKAPNIEMKYLSMGMSDDFETAIEEGSNMVRVGRVIFGERKK